MEYRLTEKGRAFAESLKALPNWPVIQWALEQDVPKLKGTYTSPFFVLFFLADEANAEGFVSITPEILAARGPWPITGVRKCLKHLEDNGFIFKTSRFGSGGYLLAWAGGSA